MRRRETPIRSTLPVIEVPADSWSPVKIILCLMLMLMLAGCIPIGARVSNMYAQAAAPTQSV